MVGEETDIDALIGDIIYKFQKMTVRRMILRDHKRPTVVALKKSESCPQR